MNSLTDGIEHPEHPADTGRNFPDQAPITVINLETGEEAGEWYLPPEEAVIAAYAQLEMHDHNTWDYAERYRGRVVFGTRTVWCASYTARRGGAR